MNAKMRLFYFLLMGVGVLCSSDVRAESNSYIGKWYFDDVAACKAGVGIEDNGVIEYTSKSFDGYEVSCKISKVIARGSKTELMERCASEGDVTPAKETVEVVDGKLKRYWKDTTGKTGALTYSRCP